MDSSEYFLFENHKSINFKKLILIYLLIILKIQNISNIDIIIMLILKCFYTSN